MSENINWKEFIFHRRQLIALMLTAFLLGLLTGGSLYWHSKRQLLDRDAAILQLTQDKEGLLRKLATAEVETRVLRTSQADLKTLIREKDEEITEQNNSLAFYRKLMVVNDQKEGVQLDNWAIMPTDIANSFQFQFTFVQYAKKHLDLDASVSLLLVGNQQGQTRTWNFKDLMYKPEKDFGQFTFRYFYRLEGLLRLPEDFIAEQVIVRKEKNNQSPSWEQRFLWQPGE